MTASEEATIGRQRRRMRSGEDVVAGAVDVLSLADCETTPQHKYDARTPLGQCLNSCVGEKLPASMLVRPSLVGTHGKGGVEQQHTLVGPSSEVAAGEWNIGA